MGDLVKAAAIIGAAIIIAVAISVYFSPFQTCKREVERNNANSGKAGVVCAMSTNQ